MSKQSNFKGKEEKLNPKIQKSSVQLSDEQVQATNLLELPIIVPEEDGPEITTIVPIMGVLHCAVNFSDMAQDAFENHEGEIKRAIKKAAALYYSTLSPTTIDDIEDKLITIVDASANVFAFVVSAWKHQNCRTFTDEDAFDLSNALSNVSDCMGAIKTNTDFNRPFDFAISNSNWKKDFLKPFKNIYLSENLKSFIYTFVGHFIKTESSDSHEKIYCIDPRALTEVESAQGETYEKAVSYIETEVTRIKNAFDTYPFMDDLLDKLGLSAPGRDFNLTRDLAQERMNLLYDETGVLEDMIYCTAQAPNTTDGYEENATVMYRVVRDRHGDGSYFEVYEDNDKAACSLKYLDRAVINIRSYTNALRGNIYPLNITVLEQIKSDNSKMIFQFNPFVLSVPSDAVGFNVTYLRAVLNINALNAAYDMANDAVSMYIDEVNTDAGTLEMITKYTFGPTPTSGDYLIGEDDIESVISDAVFDLLYDCKSTVTAADGVADSQTLGNNGQN